jgi:hypothetical protein
VTACAAWLTVADAQQLIDRVVARVNGSPITLSDVKAATALGIVGDRSAPEPTASPEQQLIDRALMLVEVARFPPPEPAAADIDKQVAAYRERLGDRLPQAMQETGIDEQHLRQMARDSLRIQAYLAQRFGTSTAVPQDEVRQYYEARPTEFTRNGRLLPFEDVEPQARAAAAAARRRVTITQWLRDLQSRADIAIVGTTIRD